VHPDRGGRGDEPVRPDGLVRAGGAVRRRLRVTGTVQGVGFRPFVYRHAVRLGLAGHVGNDNAGVVIEVEGPAAALDELAGLLVTEAPPLARVRDVSAEALPAAGARGFSIVASDATGDARVAVSVDTGPCAGCLAEVDDPSDRRHGYPFTNCTDCGPRYTIVRSVPYDRPATTMAGFAMCGDCRREYEDPGDRRFHAQPNACPACGPRLGWWTAPAGVGGMAGGHAPGGAGGMAGGHAPGGAGGSGGALAAAAAALGAGSVVAVKGVGGYHLAADATSLAAVATLRRRKARDDKPLAVMVADLAMAERLVEMDPAATELLTSPRRPIVLARRRVDAPVAEQVAPGLPELGIMLPYSPLHHLLMAAVGRPLVMTSGNLSDEPIAYTDDDARNRLGRLVDGILSHDRPIHIRCDDSVVRATGAGGQMVRRSRGYAPEPLALPRSAPRAVLAVGAELKSTVAVAKGATVVASHHLGDLEHLATYRSFLEAIAHLGHICGVDPEIVAHDLHPEYLSTKFAVEMGVPTVGVQHHHAHIAACLVDHGRSGPVVGLAFDGLGFGPDGTLWGGEVLVADLDGYERTGHLAAVPMPGGAAAVRQPWRMAMAWVYQACGPEAARAWGLRLDRRADGLMAVLRRPAGQPVTTSAGRLFDAVAALVCGRAAATYEGQAAIELEARAAPVGLGEAGAYPVRVEEEAETGAPRAGAGEPGAGPGRCLVIDPAPMVVAVLADLERGRPPAEVAAAFHDGLANAAVAAAAAVADERGLGTVALSGGVFQNVRLTAGVASGLRRHGLEVLVHRHIPPNDGGISIGQAAVAAATTDPPGQEAPARPAQEAPGRPVQARPPQPRRFPPATPARAASAGR
jgi:hydrogenase maturation protein HypF